MAKLLLIVIVGVVVYFIVRSYARSVAKSAGQTPRARPGEDMVRCAQCGVHLPKSESIVTHGKFFCSEEHRRLHSP